VEHVCDRVGSQHCNELCQGTRGRDCVVFSAFRKENMME
jgi:hypothetical protein